MNNGTILKQRYKILRHIGSGGMAEVYLAEDLLLNRQVAQAGSHKNIARPVQ